MNRLRATGSVAYADRDVAPVSGTPEYATDGNPGITPSTLWPAYMFNMMMDEFCAVITGLGITLDDTIWSQMRQAILGFSSANAQVITSTPGSPLSPTNAGLIIVDATAGNIAITLPPAAAANGAALRYRFVRRDATGNTVQISLHSGDTLFLGGGAGPISLSALQSQEIVGDGVSKWVETLPPHGMQAFTSSTSFIVPDGVTGLWAAVIPSGPGGGGCNSSGGVASGGGGGGYAEGYFSVVPGTVIPVTASPGGAGGSSAGGNGGAGGTASFGSLLSATPGSPGIGVTGATAGAGATPGAGSGGQFNMTGSASTTVGNMSVLTGGTGGSTYGQGSQTPNVGGGGGQPGNWPGAGGNGAGGGTGLAGGAGAGSLVVVRW